MTITSKIREQIYIFCRLEKCICKQSLWFATPSLPQSNPVVFPRTSQMNITSKWTWIISCSYKVQTELSCLWILAVCLQSFLLTFPHSTSPRSINFLRPNGMPLHLHCLLWKFSIKHFFPLNISKYLVWTKYHIITSCFIFVLIWKFLEYKNLI